MDGIVRFDRAKDAADMRLMPDPKETFDVTTLQENGPSHDNCMQGTEEFMEQLFGFSKK